MPLRWFLCELLQMDFQHMVAYLRANLMIFITILISLEGTFFWLTTRQANREKTQITVCHRWGLYASDQFGISSSQIIEELEVSSSDTVIYAEYDLSIHKMWIPIWSYTRFCLRWNSLLMADDRIPNESSGINIPYSLLAKDTKCICEPAKT